MVRLQQKRRMGRRSKWEFHHLPSSLLSLSALNLSLQGKSSRRLLGCISLSACIAPSLASAKGDKFKKKTRKTRICLSRFQMAEGNGRRGRTLAAQQQQQTPAGPPALVRCSVCVCVCVSVFSSSPSVREGDYKVRRGAPPYISPIPPSAACLSTAHVTSPRCHGDGSTCCRQKEEQEREEEEEEAEEERERKRR